MILHHWYDEVDCDIRESKRKRYKNGTEGYNCDMSYIVVVHLAAGNYMQNINI